MISITEYSDLPTCVSRPPCLGLVCKRKPVSPFPGKGGGGGGGVIWMYGWIGGEGGVGGAFWVYGGWGEEGYRGDNGS